MKAFRLLATSLLVALSMGISSCGDDELEQVQMEEIYPNGDSFSTYGLNIMDYECRGSNYMGNINYFSGLKDDHLWISTYDRTTKERLLEWTDSRTFNRKRTVHLGYGEYKDIEISSITTYGACAKNNIFVASVCFSGESYSEYNILFQTATGNLKEMKDTKASYIVDWYKESVFVGNCCYNDMGDTIYVSPSPNGTIGGVPISYEEAISVSINYGYKPQYILASRNNYKSGQTVWNTEYKLPFEVFNDTQKEYTLLDSSTNIWKYNLHLLYYSGEQKDYTFYLNIDNGIISESPDASPLLGKWLYTTEAGNKEIITFNGDNTGSWESVDIYDNSSSTDTFSYTVNGNEFIIDFGDGSPETYRYEIADNEMKLTYEDGHTEVYTKQ